MNKTRSFSAVLEPLRTGLGWTIVRVPFDVPKVWGARGRLRVKGEINGFPFRTSLFPTREGRHFILVNKQMQKGGRTGLGKKVEVRLELDSEERIVTIPAELKRVLSEDRILLRWFKKLNYSIQKWLTDWIDSAKSPATRQRRAEQAAEQLLSAMEAEEDLPPMIRQAFARSPRAWEGWNQMSELRRRGNLLAIFFYRTLESRSKRLEKVIEEAEELAEKRRSKPKK